jgi:hypothetical protein
MRAQVHLFTFKEGLLARLAHDLRLSVGQFEVRIDQNRVVATFDAASLHVDGVARGEHVDPNALSVEDKAKIETTIRRELLTAAEHPKIELNGTLQREGAGFAIEAELHLHGHVQGLRVPVRLERGRAFSEVELLPSRFGIPPYKALGGAIRLQDRVVVRVELLEELDKLEALASSGGSAVFEPV